MQIVNVVLGAILLFFGRTLYWVFVGIVGFLLGMALAEEYLSGQTEIVRIAAALAAGIVGAVIAIFAQRIAFAVGGFFAGGYIALSIARHFGAAPDNNTIWFIVGGLIGAVVAAMLMDWAIIVLSSLAGSAAILAGLSGIEMDSSVRSILFLVLAIVGIVVQGRRIAQVPPAATA
jgi:hypothetical protein